MLKVAIFGSCVTHDACAPAKVVHYTARQSLISLNSEPVPVHVPPGLDRWISRNIKCDARKDIFGQLFFADFDVLLIDLLEMRLLCRQDGEGRLLTFSEYVQALGDEFVDRCGLAPLDEPWPYASRLDAALDRFAIGIQRSLHGRPAILHKFWWSNDGLTDPEALAEVDRQNALLATCYDGLQKRINLTTVGLPPHQPADPNHRYGAAPYHLTGDYYAAIWSQIEAVVHQPRSMTA